MKINLLGLTSLLMLLMFSTSIVFAVIALPPSAPQDDPPGPSISHEQVQLISRAQKECDRIKQDVYDRCRATGAGHDECRERSLKAYQSCLEAMKFLIDPPKIVLPNDGSPGQKK